MSIHDNRCPCKGCYVLPLQLAIQAARLGTVEAHSGSISPLTLKQLSDSPADVVNAFYEAYRAAVKARVTSNRFDALLEEEEV